MVPDRFRSWFHPDTLSLAAAQRSRMAVQRSLFFRSALTANVIESERRTYQPTVVLDGPRAKSARCPCTPGMKPDDLCRHLAVLIAENAAADGRLMPERFEASLWRTIGFAAFAEGQPIEPAPADPREQMLRTISLTDQEQRLLHRGSGSQRLLWEVSPWYQWAKSMFLRDPDLDSQMLEVRGGRLAVGSTIIPAEAAEAVISSGLAERSGFEVAPQCLQPSLAISLDADRSLRFRPVLIDGSTIHRRDALSRYGRFFLIDRCFASPASAPPLFAGDEQGQVSLFGRSTSSGLPLDRETVVPERDVFAFVQRHRAELAAMPAELAPEAIRCAEPVRLEGEVVFDVRSHDAKAFGVELLFAGGVTGTEIARARRQGWHALLRGNQWIDVRDNQFECLDHLPITGDGLRFGALDLVRARGTLRGRSTVRGDDAAANLFRVGDHDGSGDAPAPAAFGLDLYDYQQTGYRWLSFLQHHGFGGLLCDDMGLGKTHQAMALIAATLWSNRDAAVLVVAPTSVLDHWREKLERWIPGHSVTLTSYGIVRSRIEQFRRRKWDLLVLDEAQTIKNAGTSTNQALQSLEREVAIGLTGTPIENHEDELRTLLDFVVPGYLPRGIEDRRLLSRLVRPFVLRRTKQQVLKELPPKFVDKRRCEMTAEQRAIYRSVLDSRARPLRDQLHTGRFSYLHVFAALNFLKQVCNHPTTAGGGYAQDASSGKFELLVELLDECIGSGLKVVVFSQYLRMLELIEQHLASRSIGFATIKGATRERGAEVRRFRDDSECHVFTASLRAGGLGIDLTPASVVIHYDRWWNQAREDQATDRVHRLGQNKGVQVIKLITRDSVEEKIDELIDRKGKLAGEVVREDDPALVKQFTIEELDELLSG